MTSLEQFRLILDTAWQRIASSEELHLLHDLEDRYESGITKISPDQEKQLQKILKRK